MDKNYTNVVSYYGQRWSMSATYRLSPLKTITRFIFVLYVAFLPGRVAGGRWVGVKITEVTFGGTPINENKHIH